jgi:tyrosyl-tRNA synthetase
VSLDLASLEARLLAPLPDLSRLSAEEQFAYIEEKAALGESIVTKAQFLERLKNAKKTGKPLRFKLGIDPTAPEIHLGHAIPLINLRRFHSMGHAIDLLFGDFTALVGDPSGRMDGRPDLTPEDVRRNMETYERQAGRVLNLKAERVKIHHNSAWLGSLTLSDWLKLTKGIGVSQLLQREDFRKRLDAGAPLNLAEAEYALLMGYDSVKLASDVEVGGMDQFLNFHFCRDMMAAAGQTPESFVCFDLLPGTTGERDEQGRLRKMSKSRGNYVAVEAAPEEKYGKVMSVPDEVMWVWYRELTEIRAGELPALKAEVESGRLHPKEAKRLLARVVVATFHGYDLGVVAAAQAVFDQKFGASKILVPEDTKSRAFDPAAKLLDTLRDASGRSGAQLRGAVEQGGVSVLKGEAYHPVLVEQLAGPSGAFFTDHGNVIKIGKKDYFRFEIR